uniref:Uncharacterized protein n=1 Tax=Avena sativa TaxID=4498 RepID=A0ACD5WWA7_AVESA
MAEASDNQRMAPARVHRAVDRIGALPDDVLRRVLSQLSSREAVHTCLLAQRWRDLWRSVPIINVSFGEFEDSDDDAEDTFEREAMFKKFVNRFLMLRNPVGLDEFRLDYSSSTGDRPGDDANLWISHVLQCNAWAVKIVNRGEPLELVPGVFSSSFLKRLHISSAILVPDFFNQLQMGCPALEYLFLSDCAIRDLEIFSKTLEVLILSEEVSFDDQASISAPSLVTLSIEGDLCFGRLPILKNMTSLKTASVLLSGDLADCDADAIRQLLESLSDVRSLDFCYADRKLMMEKNFRWCPTFSNLINLTLHTWCVHAEFYGLIVFLQNSPSLKKLTVKLKQEGMSAITGELEDRSFTCEQLEIVEIICLETSELLPRVTRFLRDSGIRLDQMRIVTGTKSDVSVTKNKSDVSGPTAGE